jgi:uncharacterized protein DUF4382
MGHKAFFYIGCVAVLALLNGCGNGNGTSDSSFLSLGVTDAPVGTDVTNVFVQFHGVEVHGPQGTTTINFTTPKQIDLLAQTGNIAAPLLTNAELPAGQYEWIRLLVDTDGTDDTFLINSTGHHELTIPSGAETGLKLVQGFTLAQGAHANFTIDFNVAHSLVSNANGFILKPALRLVDNEQVGTLSGKVDGALTAAHCTGTDMGAVYVYTGTITTPTDISGAATDPITTAKVATDGTGKYMVGFLAAGSYTAAWTCDASKDDPTVVNTLAFFGVQSFTITANTTTTVNFNP